MRGAGPDCPTPEVGEPRAEDAEQLEASSPVVVTAAVTPAPQQPDRLVRPRAGVGGHDVMASEGPVGTQPVVPECVLSFVAELSFRCNSRSTSATSSSDAVREATPPMRPRRMRRQVASVHRVADGVPSTLFLRPYLRVHQWTYRTTRGWIGRRSGGHPVLLLNTTGRRSGLPRTTAVIFTRDGSDMVVVASNGGSDRPPSWLVNLQTEPHVSVQIGRKQFAATARIADGPDHDRLWDLANRHNRGLSRLFHRGVRGRYDVYQRHTDRPIPVVVLREIPQSAERG